MTSHFLKKLALSFSLVAITTGGIIYACSDYFWGYDYDSNFTPETYIDKSYSPLFFSSQEAFYGIGFDDAYNSRFNTTIVEDWSNYVGNKINKETLSYFLLVDTSAADVELLYKCIASKQKNEKWANLNLKNKKVANFITFMHYAKEIETYTTQNPGWDYDNEKMEASLKTAPELLTAIQNKYTTTTDAFLKNRYWFQTMKAYFYSNAQQDMISFFETTKTQVPLNTLYYRALSYVAGAYYQQKNYTKANYLYSVVFDKCAEMRTVTAYNFKPQEQNDFDAALTLATNTNEKCALWALQGYCNDEQQAISEIYTLDAKNKHLDFLLARLINKEETRLNGYDFQSTKNANTLIKDTLNKEIIALVNKIAKEQKTTQPYLWNCAAGYLSIFNGEHTLATTFFEKAEKQTPNTPLAIRQLRLLKLINKVSETKVMDTNAEYKLLADLDWLYNTCTKDTTNTNFRYRRALKWTKSYIASLYQQQHNDVFAQLFDRSAHASEPETQAEIGATFFYSTEKNQEAMKTFLTKQNKTPWETLAQSGYNVSFADLCEYQAVMSTYNGNIDKAVTYMQQSTSDGGDFLGNPFNGKIQDCNDCDHAAIHKIKYTKLSLLLKIKEMQTNIQQGVDVHNNSLLIGNAMYNITYYGNGRTFYEGNITNQYGNYIDDVYKPYLLNCEPAKAYYSKAFNAATTNEQKAKCAYLMAKCERNTFYTKQYHKEKYDFTEHETDFLAWENFKLLKEKYAKTNYYKEVINECGYFRKYLGLE